MRYPEFLKPGGTIGFIAPSMGAATEPYSTCFAAAKENLSARGYKIAQGDNCHRADGIGISNTPEKCGAEVNEFFSRADVDVIISCGGGELMCEVLEHIDFERLKESAPKWFMGYSDNTNLTFLLPLLSDTAAIYGPCAKAFGQRNWHESIEDAFATLTGQNRKLGVVQVHGYDSFDNGLTKAEDPLDGLLLTEKKILRRYNGSQAATGTVTMTGRLIGGCMDCLTTLVGTRFDHVPLFVNAHRDEGIIWFMESCDLNVMSIRRALWQMEKAGWFKYVKGFIIGRPGCYGQELLGMDQYLAVTGILGKYNVPLILDADIGHLSPQMPLISGSMATVISDNETDIRVNMSLE